MTDRIQNRVVRIFEKEILNVNHEIQSTTRRFVFLPKLSPLVVEHPTYARSLATNINLSDRKRVVMNLGYVSAVFHKAFIWV